MRETVLQALASSGPPPPRLELESTETILLQKTELVGRTMRRLRQLGIRIALDDFGTGYSRLSCLHHLSLDTVKIDRSFVVAMSSRKMATIMPELRPGPNI